MESSWEAASDDLRPNKASSPREGIAFVRLSKVLEGLREEWDGRVTPWVIGESLVLDLVRRNPYTDSVKVTLEGRSYRIWRVNDIVTPPALHDDVGVAVKAASALLLAIATKPLDNPADRAYGLTRFGSDGNLSDTGTTK